MANLVSDIKSRKKWLANNETDVELYIKGIESALVEKNVFALMDVADDLRRLSVFFGKKSHVDCYDCMPGRDLAFSKSIMYSYWSVKISVECVISSFGTQEEKSKRMLGVIDLLCCTLAALISVDGGCLADEIGELLLKVYNFGSVREIYFKERTFESFMVWLYLVKKDPSQASIELQVEGVFKTASERFSRETADCVFELVQFHKLHSRDGKGRWRSEFLFSPFDIFVFEIVALSKVLGVTTLPSEEMVDFCLEACTLFNPQPDEICQKVEDAYNEVLLF